MNAHPTLTEWSALARSACGRGVLLMLTSFATVKCFDAASCCLELELPTALEPVWNLYGRQSLRDRLATHLGDELSLEVTFGDTDDCLIRADERSAVEMFVQRMHAMRDEGVFDEMNALFGAKPSSNTVRITDGPCENPAPTER